MRAVWHDFLIAFPYQVAQEASKSYIRQGGKFFPAIGEFVKICDEIWQKQEGQRRQDERDDDMVSYRKLFREPIATFPNDYRQAAVELIRDVTEGRVKYMSADWNTRYRSIFPGYNPATGIEI